MGSRQPRVVIDTDIRPGCADPALLEAPRGTDQAARFEPVNKEKIRVRYAAESVAIVAPA